MNDDLVEGLRLVGRTFMPELMHGSANEIERLRAEVGEAIAERDRLFIRGREWAELSGRMERERDALRARVDGAPIVEVVEIGDDDSGQPRVLAHSTRDELGKGGVLVFRRVALVPVDE